MHEHGTIDRWSIAYWVAGDGFWSPRWQCTSHDAFLMVVQVATTLWMAYEYCRYATQCEKTFREIPLSNARKHIEYLRIVFLQCVAIHILMSIVTWFVTPYFFIIWLTLWNALTARRLNSTGIIQQHANDLIKDQEDEERNRRAIGVLASSVDTTTKLQQAMEILNQTMQQKGS